MGWYGVAFRCLNPMCAAKSRIASEFHGGPLSVLHTVHMPHMLKISRDALLRSLPKDLTVSRPRENDCSRPQWPCENVPMCMVRRNRQISHQTVVSVIRYVWSDLEFFGKRMLDKEYNPCMFRRQVCPWTETIMSLWVMFCILHDLGDPRGQDQQPVFVMILVYTVLYHEVRQYLVPLTRRIILWIMSYSTEKSNFCCTVVFPMNFAVPRPWQILT